MIRDISLCFVILFMVHYVYPNHYNVLLSKTVKKLTKFDFIMSFTTGIIHFNQRLNISLIRNWLINMNVD